MDTIIKSLHQDLDKIIEDLDEKLSQAKDVLEEYVETNQLSKKGFAYVGISGTRSGRPRVSEDDEKPKRQEAAHLSGVAVDAGTRLVERFTRIRRSHAEAVRARNAVISNLRMMEKEVNGIPQFVDSFCAAAQQFNEARRRESMFNASIAGSPSGNGTTHSFTGTERKGMAKKKTKAKGTGRPKDERTKDQLLGDLAKAQKSGDKEAQRRIRAKLRARGHTGGLGQGRGRPAAKKKVNKKKVNQKKTKRK